MIDKHQQAFPAPASVMPPSSALPPGSVQTWSSPGMTKREHAAILICQGLCASGLAQGSNFADVETIAIQIADRLLDKL